MGYMNPTFGKHMSGGKSGPPEHGDHNQPDKGTEPSGAHGMPSIHIHTHAKGHTVHIMHHNGQHTKHEHAHGDAEGIAAHIHQHLGGGGEPPQESHSIAGEDATEAGPY